jgi:hypothetical protein
LLEGVVVRDLLIPGDAALHDRPGRQTHAAAARAARAGGRAAAALAAAAGRLLRAPRLTLLALGLLTALLPLLRLPLAALGRGLLLGLRDRLVDGRVRVHLALGRRRLTRRLRLGVRGIRRALRVVLLALGLGAVGVHPLLGRALRLGALQLLGLHLGGRLGVRIALLRAVLLRLLGLELLTLRAHGGQRARIELLQLRRRGWGRRPIGLVCAILIRARGWDPT